MQPAKTAKFFVKRISNKKKNREIDKPGVVDQFDIIAYQ